MKLCEFCNEKHCGDYATGRFCDIKCARAFSTMKNRKEISTKVSKSLTQHGRYCRDTSEELLPFCAYCGKEKKSSRYRYCSTKCRVSYLRYSYINKWSIGLESGSSYNGSVSDHIRNYLFEKYNSKCQKCGWGELNPYSNKIPLAVHHVDGNCGNNTIDNLELLCPNCHALTSNYGSRNTGNSIRRNK